MLPTLTLVDRYCSSSKQLSPHWLFFSVIFFRFSKLSLFVVFFHCSLLFLYTTFLSHKIFPYFFCNWFSFKTVRVVCGWRTHSCFEIQIIFDFVTDIYIPIFETKNVTNLLISKTSLFTWNSLSMVKPRCHTRISCLNPCIIALLSANLNGCKKINEVLTTDIRDIILRYKFQDFTSIRYKLPWFS